MVISIEKKWKSKLVFCPRTEAKEPLKINFFFKKNVANNTFERFILKMILILCQFTLTTTIVSIAFKPNLVHLV